MPYFIRTLYVDGRTVPCTESLVECSVAHTERADINRVGYDRVSGTFAHRRVRDGGRHETPLYVDSDNRIRYANEPQETYYELKGWSRDPDSI